MKAAPGSKMIARLLQEFADPEAPLIDLMMVGVRKG
jgi:hypothetical protein